MNRLPRKLKKKITKMPFSTAMIGFIKMKYSIKGFEKSALQASITLTELSKAITILNAFNSEGGKEEG